MRITSILVAAAMLAGAITALAADEVEPIQIQARVDGRSRIMVRGDQLWWYHIDWEGPGRLGSGKANLPTMVNGEKWLPKWPDIGGPKNEFAYCESSRYTLPHALPLKPLKFAVNPGEARGEIRILQQPAKANDYTLAVEVDDDEPGGAADYAFELSAEPAEEPAAPKPPADPKTLRDGLVAEYLFADGAKDTSGKAHDGKATDLTTTADRFGKANAAMLFNGKTGAIRVDDFEEVSLGGPMSVSAWVRYEHLPAQEWNAAVVSQDDGNDRRVFQLSTNGKRAVWHRMHRYGWDPVQINPLKTGQWYHLVATYDGKVHSLYVDSVLQESLPGTMQVTEGEPLFIGRKGSNEPQFFFDGAIDDVRIYKRALTSEEVVSLYQEKP